MDILTALFSSWDELFVERFGVELLPRLLARKPRVPGEFDTAFASSETLPGEILSPALHANLRLADLVAHYLGMPLQERRSLQGVAFVRCVVLLLFAHDKRMQRFMFGRHALHGIFCTRELDNTPELRTRGLAFMDALQHIADNFVAGIREVNTHDPAGPALAATITSDFVSDMSAMWIFGGYLEGFEVAYDV